ncbi:hypothetical protein WJX73_008139 [Symbiochloris irregularis]|uniref:U-box domain-containing protein n=1 Tax=Symbiochloris irregularis TaxID=706552 RepID=A0AAW1NYF4_9CHLO
MKADSHESANLAHLLHTGLASIPTRRSKNLFHELDSRALRPEEQRIIEQRVSLQRKLSDQYERNERKRKAEELIELCSDLTLEQAHWALAVHDYREEETLAAVTSRSACQAEICNKATPTMQRGKARDWEGPAEQGFHWSFSRQDHRMQHRGFVKMRSKRRSQKHSKAPVLRTVHAKVEDWKVNRTIGSNGARKPKLGRVRKCSHKGVDLVAVGKLCTEPGWHNAGYIFPQGFISRTSFRSSVQLDMLCGHECKIVGRRGTFWPQPTFIVTAADQPGAPLEAKSATGAWNAVLARINASIEARRQAGDNLPPPPKTAIPGPEYFGLTHPAIIPAIEALDPDHECSAYWAGKQGGAAMPKQRAALGSRKRRKGWDSENESSDEAEGSLGPQRDVQDSDADEETVFSCRWSSLDRAERHQRRMSARATEPCGAGPPSNEMSHEVDEDNPLPGRLDPITLQAMRRPAVSPWGHVLGMATWAAVLADSHRCPFTQQPLQREQVILLTHNNIGRFQSRLILP